MPPHVLLRQLCTDASFVARRHWSGRLPGRAGSQPASARVLERDTPPAHGHGDVRLTEEDGGPRADEPARLPHEGQGVRYHPRAQAVSSYRLVLHALSYKRFQIDCYREVSCNAGSSQERLCTMIFTLLYDDTSTCGSAHIYAANPSHAC